MIKNLFKSMNLIRRGSGTNLNLFRYAAMVVVLLTLGIGNAWAGGGNKTYYSKMNVTITSGQTGYGTVYVTSSGKTSDTKNSSASSAPTHTYNIYATANAGYKFTSWSGSGISFGSTTTANTTGAFSASSTNSGSPTEKTATASFEVIKVTAAPADVTINATDPSATYPDAAGVVVGFTTSSSNANSDFTTGGSGDSRWTISAWPTHASATSTTFNYKFVGNGSYGTNNRTFTKTVTLKGLNDATVKTCTLTAKYPNPRVVACDAEATDLTIYPTFKAADATQEAVEKTAVFDVVYADNANNFSAAFSGATGSGTWTVSSITVDQANQKATVTYTFNGNKEVGTHTAILTLTANDCNGWDDTSADGGASATVTLTAENTQEATNDASVTTTANVTTEYATFAQALAAANATSGATLTLLRNVDLGTITATNNITKAMTIDLNGKELRAAVNATSVGILTITQAVSVTIKDSKTGGRIINEIARNSEIRTIFVNKAGATLTLESGTLAVNNTGQYASAANSTLGVAKYASCAARVIHQIAGATVNINGGRVEAIGTREVYGIVQASSAATNAAGTSVLNITGGEIYAEAPYNAYGICAYGKVNMSAGVINTHINTNMVNAYYAADNANNTSNGNGYGIYMQVSVSATASSCYYGTLNMTGGTVNVISDRTKAASLYNYGIHLNAAATGVGAGKTATDGTLSQKACAKASIENATINVHSGTYYSYGINVLGSYNSYDNTYFTVPIKNSTIDVKAYTYTYGVVANCGINSTYGGKYWGDVELTGNTLTAESVTGSTAYGVYVVATTAHIFKDANTTTAPIYFGEYATAAKAVINSGTYTAKTKTSSAYAVCSSTRAKTVYDSESTVIANRKPGGNAEAYPIVIIHGGTFRGETTTSTSRAVSSGGYTTIDGGTFEAFSTTTTAYGLYAVSGKLTASGVTISANATQYAYGAYADCSVPSGNTAQTGFAYAAEMELNNCDITATTRTSTEARGVSVNATNKMHTWAGFLADSTSYTSSWAANQKNYAAYYRRVFPCTVAGRDSVGIAIAAKATINGCDVKVTAGTTTAYGVYSTATSVPASADSVASPVVSIKNSKFTVATNGTTSAYGVYAGGPTTIDGCDFTVQPKSTTAYGVYVYDKKTTITNTKFDVKGTTTAYGIYANAAIGSTTGWDYHGEVELGEGNDLTAAATGGNTSHVLTLIAAKKNVASGRFAGDYANAASALITGGKYKATATGTTSYVLNLSAEQVQNAVKAAPSCTIEGGKFWAKADGGTTGICTTNGVAGNILFKGGVYNVNTTLSKHIPEGYEEVPLASDRPEYSPGYRYEVDKAGMHGIDVCQIGSTKYKSLEEALQVVTSGQVIYMIANYTMTTPGDYVLPAGATLLIPYKTGSGKGATTPIGNAAETTTSATTPSLFRKLTFGNGVNLICYGTIETSAQQKANGQYNANVGMPSGAYGQIQMDEGSHISMEGGSRLNCWGYITGKGTINVKNNATVLEGFQLGDWCGGTNATTLTGSSNRGKAFPITHYFYQSIECPITYRPGAKALGSTHVNMSFVGTVGQDAVPLVGTSDAMFIMDNVNASEDTWVMKDYDETTDYCYWTINSGASIGNLIVKIPNAIDVNSADYVLPICSNMAVVLNYGEGSIGQHAVFTPGSKLIINKEGTLVLNNVNVSVLDLTEYTGATIYRASYSPTWGTTNPRSTSVVDAEVFVHGKVDLRGNGGLYTSASGANIHSTNADAGQVLYTSAAQGNKTTYYLKNAATSATAVTVNAAKLRNEDNTYSSTGGTSAGDVWVYVNGKWTKKTKEGCFSVETTDVKHYYIQPSDIVEVNYPAQSNHTYTSVTGSRVFVWDADCYWWEVETTPTAEGYFKATTADHNGKYNYYYYDSSAACWKIKTITVTWNINGSNTNYSVGYGTKPEWLGATPTKTSSSSNYVWRWDGWTKGSDATVIANNDLPIVTENTTFTAHFYEKYYEYNVTFKNSDGTILDSRNWIAGTTPSYEGTPTKNPTVDYTYEFNTDNPWTPAITTVSGSATYTANYKSIPRKYTVTFLNYDMSVLGTAEVVYNGTPSNATYLAAVAPVTEDPYKPDNSAFSFEFAGWRLQGASSNGFAQVKGNQTYIAQYTQTTKKYKISFVDDDGETVLHYLQLEYGQTPSYTWADPDDKQDVEWNYSFDHWDPSEFAVVEGAQTYTAVYNKTKRKYTITWIDGNGATLKTDQVAYGETPEYSGATPQKASTSDHSYVFNNTWLPAIVPVVGEASYTAQFNETERTYRVTWDAATNGGTCVTEYTDFSYNAAIGTLPVASKEGHTFNGWFTSASGGTQITAATKVTADVTYHAQFTINTHSLAWNANGGTLSGSYTSGTVTYGTTIAVPAVTRDGYIFDGWHDGTSIVDPASSMPDNDLTYTAQWTLAVASVAASGTPTTYHATVADAITAANDKTDAVVTMLQNASVESEVTITAAMTIDLNGKTISSAVTTAATGVFKINASGKTVTITDSGTGGKISHKANCTGYLYGINLFAGSLNVEGGYIYAENTNTTAASGNRACGIMYANDYTNPASLTVSDGTIEAKRASTYVYGISIYTGYCGLTMTGGTVKASGSGTVRGIYTQGTAVLSNVTVTATAALTGTANCYAVFSDKDGKYTINSGTYTATSTSTGTNAYALSLTKSTSSAGGSAIVNGGRFSGKSKELNISNGTITLQGGYYVHNTDLAGNCATNYHVLPASLTEGGITYNCEVAEAYQLTWNLDGGTVTTAGTPSGYVAKGATLTAPVVEKSGFTFAGWSDGSSVVTPTTMPAANTTYTATWTVAESGFWLDIVDVDNSTSTKTLTINTNSWASAGWPYTINDVGYEKSARETDRTLIIPYTGEVGASFSITVKDKNKAVVSMHTYIIPKEITSSTTLGDQQMLFVKNGATLTVNASKEVKNIYVDPDAKLVVNSGVTLTADTVFLRTKPFASAELELNGTITGQVCYTRIISKKDQYYQFGLPMPCPIAAVRLSDGTTPTYGGGWLLRSYSEQNRAQNGSGADIDNWVTLTNEGADVTIQGGVGYEMFSNSGYYREYYFPVAHTGLSDRVAVTHTTGKAGESHSGWNIVVSPLMRAYTQSPAPEGMTVSWLQQDGSYWQLPVEEIKPAIPFSYQATETGYITFGENIGLSALAPRRVAASEEQVRIQWLQLDVEAADGKTDQTSIYSHPTRYERTYKTGIDVAKQSLTASRAILYSSHVYGDMAFAGVADSLLEAGVALTVYSPSAQELTISMRENDWLNRLAEVWLIDHETGARMNLLDGNYTFDAAAGTTSGRFTIQGVFYAPQVTTDIQNGQGEDAQGAKARKVIIEDKMYILLNGQMFDATGKMVNK